MDLEQGLHMDLELERRLGRLGFSRLSPKDKPLFDPYYDRLNDYWASSVCFASMNAWNHSVVIYHKVIRTYIVCLAWDYYGKRMVLLPFLGYYRQEDINETMEAVREILTELKLPLVMTDVTRWMRPYYERVPNLELEVIDDRDLQDYIYRADDFVHAMDTQERRYDYRYFIRKYQPVTEIITPGHQETCMEFLKRVWCTEHICEECRYGCLLDTISYAVAGIDKLDAHGILVRVENRVVGYCVVTCRKGLGIYHFKKTERGFRGINEYLHKECFTRFLSDARIINYTEDMGSEGLRKYKCRLAPYTLEPKYELRER